MHRILAIVERDLRKFFRSPALMVASMIFPLLQLLILGHAFGGKIRDLEIGLVDQDHSSYALEVRKRLGAIQAGPQTFRLLEYPNLRAAQRDLRGGKIAAILHIPENFSRDVHARNRPRLALIVDNTDNFKTNALLDQFRQLVEALNQPAVPLDRLRPIRLEAVEVYPYVSYMKYLLPGSISLAIYVTSMIGGGIIFIDDRARGLHEGYLVTPIRASELVLGLTFAGAVKGLMTGMVLVIVGGLIAGVEQLWEPVRLFYLMLVVSIASLALISLTFLIFVRVQDPLVPRAMMGVLMTLLFFPSGAVYPIEGFPRWLKWLSMIDPFTYTVDALQNLILRHTGFAGIYTDLLYLLAFSVVTTTGAIRLFQRTV